MQLNKRPGWEPGMGLEFRLTFEKVRYGDKLAGFDAKYSSETGWQRIEEDTGEVVSALRQGKSIREVAKDLGVNRNTVAAIRKKAEAAGTEFPKPKAKTAKAGS